MKKNLFVVSAYILAIAMIANNLSPLNVFAKQSDETCTTCSISDNSNDNGENIEDYIEQYKQYDNEEESNIYVLFEREDCKECKEFVPEFKKITKSFKTKILYIDTKTMTKEEKVNCKKKYNVEYVPTILYFSNHKLKDTLIGQQPYDKLEDFVKGKQQ